MEEVTKVIEYWKNKLQDVALLQLPTDYTRPPVHGSQVASVEFVLDKKLSDQIKIFSRQQDTTLFITLLAAYKVLLNRYTGQQDICVGTSISNCSQPVVKELNILALRSDVKGDESFNELVQRVKVTVLEACEHQEVPFEKVVAAVVKERDTGRNPLFQVMFILQDVPQLSSLSLAEVQVSKEVYKSNTSQVDLAFIVEESALGIKGVVKYCTELFSRQTIERMAGHYNELLNSIVKQPHQKIGLLSLLTAAEEQQLLVEFNNMEADYPKDKTIVDLFEEQAGKTPQSVAVVFEEERITYKQLNERANQLAHYLIGRGEKAETLIPICIERSLEMIVGILGILKSGGAYVPIDPEYPEDRIKFMLEDIKAKVVVSSSQSCKKLSTVKDLTIIELDNQWADINKQPTNNLPIIATADNLAYVIYTSGSTGTPKGVLIKHHNVVTLFKSANTLFDFNEKDVWSMFHSFSFDFSVWEMYGALFYGGRLVIVPKLVTQDISLFASLLINEQVTVLNQTPSAFYVLQDFIVGKANMIPMRYVIFGGEALHLAKLQPWKEAYSNCKIINMYGITETTVHVTYQEIGWQHIRGGKSVIGKQIPTLTAYILDSYQNLLPVGVAGELCIGGTGLARGYLNRPELTAEKFVKNPFTTKQDARMYKSGDLGRWLPDGNIEYLGRIDNQAKIRGYRIELGEIESAMNKLDHVNSSCVVVKKDHESTNRLVGYYVPDGQIVKEKERELYTRLVSNWKQLYEIEYAKTEVAEDIDPESNIIGWNDSFTEQPIPAEQMQEWLHDIIEVIMSEKPEYVLEIGSGTGLIYYQLAGKVKKYVGTDFSRSSINQISERISKGLRDYGPTELHVCAAHEVSLKEGEKVDTIILNSVVQYFPGEDYMTDVIGKNISFLKDKGRIIVGDVRDNRLLELFKARLQIKKLQKSVSINEFKWAVEQEVLKEEELCFSPDYFYRLQSLYPRITHIEIKSKQGSYINELTLYRFTVIIYVGMETEVFKPNWQSWKDLEDKQMIISQLQQDNIVGIKDVPNPRLWQERLLDNGLQDKFLRTVGDLLNTIGKEDIETIEVKNILAHASNKGYSYRFLLDEDPLKVNVVFEPKFSNRFIEQPYSKKTNNASTLSTNIPLFTDISVLLQKDIRLLLKQSLPDYMVPSEIISLRQLPLNNNGKVDRSFLSQREDRGHVNKINYIAPRNEREQALANIWQELLNIEIVSMNDNFFELGGHSLLAMRLSSYIERNLLVSIPLHVLFKFSTISELSRYLEIQASASANNKHTTFELIDI